MANSLSHTKWVCKYHIVLIPKYRRKGINAIPAAVAFADKYNVDMPIVRAVDAIVNHQADPRAVVASLMERDKRTELY